MFLITTWKHFCTRSTSFVWNIFFSTIIFAAQIAIKDRPPNKGYCTSIVELFPCICIISATVYRNYCRSTWIYSKNFMKSIENKLFMNVIVLSLLGLVLAQLRVHNPFRWWSDQCRPKVCWCKLFYDILTWQHFLPHLCPGLSWPPACHIISLHTPSCKFMVSLRRGL